LLDKYHKRKDALNNNITYTVHTNLPPDAAVQDGPEPAGEMYTWSLGRCTRAPSARVARAEI